jgi:hypothetical protein
MEQSEKDDHPSRANIGSDAETKEHPEEFSTFLKYCVLALSHFSRKMIFKHIESANGNVEFHEMIATFQDRCEPPFHWDFPENLRY